MANSVTKSKYLLGALMESNYRSELVNEQIVVDCTNDTHQLKSNNLNSPVALLKHIMSLRNKSIDFDLVFISGQVHMPEFKYQVKSENMITYGSGSSKKEAKKNAAIAFLKMLDDYNSNNAISSTTINDLCSPLKEDHVNRILEAKLEINPIGVLQELCMARKWPLPDYEFKKTNNNVFKVVCFLNIHKSEGEGKKKQAAKTQAARFMYEQVKVSSQEKTLVVNTSKYLKPGKILLNCINSVDVTMKLTDCNESNVLKYVEIFFKHLRTSMKPSINKLKIYNSMYKFNKNSIDILNKIGEEEGFNVMFTTMSKNNEILGQVSIFPFLVNIGTGATIEEAHKDAACVALLYLKLMLGN